MKSTYILCCALALLLFHSPSSSFVGKPEPLFIPNNGQVKDQFGHQRTDIDFNFHAANGLEIFIGRTGMHYQWSKKIRGNSGYEMCRLDVVPIGHNPNAKIIIEEAGQNGNSLSAHHAFSKGWAFRRVHKITYQDIYPNIDWVFYFNDKGKLEHDFIVHPKGKVSDIMLTYNGASSLTIDKNGALHAITPFGQLSEAAPFTYQKKSKGKIESRFLLSGNTISFQVDTYKGTIVIDPTIEWASYFGGADREYAMGTVTDRFGNVYIAGNTSSTSAIATTGSFQSTYGGGLGSSTVKGDAFVAKYRSNGTLVWASYFGGSNDDAATGIATDNAGNVYLTGWTKSSNGIATTSAYQTFLSGIEDAFLAKFDSTGNLQWGTYYGGSSSENAFTIGGIYVDPLGNSYLTGKTNSTSGIATSSTHQPLSLGGTSDAFLVKFNTNGQRIWGTYFGGSTTNRSTVGTAVCGVGNAIYITGNTTSLTGLATIGAFKGTYGGGTADAYIARFDTAGSLQWASYFGGTLDDRGTSITCNSNQVYLNGVTKSTSGIGTTGSHQPSIAGNQDAFLAQFSSTGQLNWSSYYGGSSLDGAGNTMVLDPMGNVYVTGATSSTSGIATTVSPQPTNGGGADGYIAKFNPSGVRQWGTYYGGSASEDGFSLTTNGSGILYLCGGTQSSAGIATTGSQQSNFAGDNDGYITRINDCIQVAKPDTILGPLSLCKGTQAKYHINPVLDAVSYTWIIPTGWTGTANVDTLHITAGSGPGLIKVVAVGICSASDTQILAVNVLPQPIISPNAPRVCFGDSILLSASPVLPVLQWYHNNMPVNGTPPGNIYASMPGNYYVVSTNASCIDTSNTVSLVVNPLPTVSPITRTGQVLSLGQTFAGYQWNFNGSPIIGATGASFTFSIDGSYSVSVTDTNGCKSTSEPLNTTSSSVQSISDLLLVPYPNPARDEFNVKVKIDGWLSIMTIDGRMLACYALETGPNKISIHGYPPGIYLLHFMDNLGCNTANSKITTQ